MNGSLLRTLIEKNFVSTGIELKANYKGHDLSGAPIVAANATFTMVSYRFVGETEVAILGQDIVDGRQRIFYAQSIVDVDGMDPVRYAESYGIDENGGKIVEGKRRGRKPKNRQVEEESDDLDIEDVEFEDNEVFE